MPRKLTIEHCHKLASDRNGKFLSSKYHNTETKYNWKCQCDHTFSMSHHMVRQGQWCPKCYQARRSAQMRTPIETYHQLAQKHNGKCLSLQIDNCFQKLTWECEYKHTWEARAYSVKDGHWCPKCNHNLPMTLEDYRAVAKSKHGEYISDNIPLNTVSPTRWKCENKHIWVASFHSINVGSWCPICGATGQTQQKLFKIIQNIYPNYKCLFNYKGFDWLVGPVKKMEIDIFVVDIKLAIEYDGKQHYEPIEYWGGESAFLNRQKNDRTKDKLISQHTEDVNHFIRIPYTEKITLKNVLKILSINNILVDIPIDD